MKFRHAVIIVYRPAGFVAVAVVQFYFRNEFFAVMLLLMMLLASLFYMNQ